MQKQRFEPPFDAAIKNVNETLRILEHLSYVIEAALVGAIGEAKTQLALLVESIETKDNGESAFWDEIDRDLTQALDHLAHRLDEGHSRRAFSLLSRVSRKLWNRVDLSDDGESS